MAPALDSRNDALNAELKRIDDDTTALDARMDAHLQSAIRSSSPRSTALLTQLQSTSNYLSSQLANLPGTR